MANPRLINVRGCNGSGKTTVVRSVMGGTKAWVIKYPVPDHKDVPVTFTNVATNDGLLAAIGDYKKEGCSGLDRIKTQAAAKYIVETMYSNPQVHCVLFEGVLVSTIFEPWLEWSRKMGGMTWAFLDTPIDVCLARVQERNGGKPVKEDQIRGKHRTIARIRDKSTAAGERVLDLPWELAEEALLGEIYAPFHLHPAQHQALIQDAQERVMKVLAPEVDEKGNNVLKGEVIGPNYKGPSVSGTIEVHFPNMVMDPPMSGLKLLNIAVEMGAPKRIICGDCDHFDSSLWNKCRFTLEQTTRTADASQLPCYLPKDKDQ